MEEKIVNGERVVVVKDADEFLAAISGAVDKGEFEIDAPPGLAESLGFTDVAPKGA